MHPRLENKVFIFKSLHFLISDLSCNSHPILCLFLHYGKLRSSPFVVPFYKVDSLPLFTRHIPIAQKSPLSLLPCLIIVVIIVQRIIMMIILIVQLRVTICIEISLRHWWLVRWRLIKSTSLVVRVISILKIILIRIPSSCSHPIHHIWISLATSDSTKLCPSFSL